jgi:hypothetical protein
MKEVEAYGGVEVWLHLFLISAVDVGEGSTSRSSRFPPGERVLGTFE